MSKQVVSADGLRDLSRATHDSRARLNAVTSELAARLSSVDRSGWSAGGMDGAWNDARGRLGRTAGILDGMSSKLDYRARLAEQLNVPAPGHILSSASRTIAGLLGQIDDIRRHWQEPVSARRLPGWLKRLIDQVLRVVTDGGSGKLGDRLAIPDLPSKEWATALTSGPVAIAILLGPATGIASATANGGLRAAGQTADRTTSDATISKATEIAKSVSGGIQALRSWLVAWISQTKDNHRPRPSEVSELMNILDKTPSGRKVVEWLDEYGVEVTVGDVSNPQAIAETSPDGKHIVLNKQWAGFSKFALAGVLLHEGQHSLDSHPLNTEVIGPVFNAIYNPVFGVLYWVYPYPEEYRAFRAQAEYWRSVRPTIKDDDALTRQLDAVVDLIFTKDGHYRNVDAVYRDLHNIGYESFPTGKSDPFLTNGSVT